MVLGPLAHDPVGVHLLSDQDDGGVLDNLTVELAGGETFGVVATLNKLVGYMLVDAVTDECAGARAGKNPFVFQIVFCGKVLGDHLTG